MNKKTISKWFSMLVVMLLAGIGSAAAQSLSIADFDIKAGETKAITIDLVEGAQPVYGVQTDLQLSEGLTLVGEPTVVEGIGVGDLSTNVVNGNKRMILLSLSNGNAAISASAKGIIKLNVKAADDFQRGTITLSNTRLTVSTAGDERPVDNFTANVMLDEKSLTIADFSMKAGETKTVTIDIAHGIMPVYGVQTDLQFSAGLSLDGDPVLVEGVGVESLKWNVLGSGNVRLIMLSLTNGNAINPDAKAIIKLNVKAAANFTGGTIKLTNSRLTINTAGQEMAIEGSTTEVTCEDTPPAVIYPAQPVGVTDHIDYPFVGVEGTAYTSWSGKSDLSTAVYAGNTAGGNESVQMRSSGNNSGIVTTASGGRVTRISVWWNENTAAARVLDVYGSDKPYSAASSLYSAVNQGTKIASFKKSDGDISIDITGDYPYIGFRSNSGALYVNDIAIDWETESAGVAAPVFSHTGGTIFGPQTVTLTAEEGATIYYVTDDSELSSLSTIYSEPITVSANTTIRAFAVKDGQPSVEVDAIYTMGNVAANIAAFKALGEGTEAVLTLTDAIVTHVYGANIFIEDATGGIDFYQTGLTGSEKGEVWNGTIIGKYKTFRNLPEFETTGATNIDNLTFSEGTVVPSVMTIPEACTPEAAARWIKIENVTVASVNDFQDGGYITDGTNQLEIYSSYGASFVLPAAGTKLTSISGLLIPYNEKYQLVPITQADIVEWTFEPTDCTAKVDVNGWKSDQGNVGNYTKDVPQKEQYNGSTTARIDGNVLYQDVTGLENGTYNVELYANASYTRNRGFATDALDGEVGRVVVFAGDVDKTIPVIYQEGVGTNNIVTLNNVVVTDGTLRMGLRKIAPGSNWHTIQIKSLTYVAPDAEPNVNGQNAYWQDIAAIVSGYEAYTNVKGVERANLIAAATQAAAEAAIPPFYAAKADYDKLANIIEKAEAESIDATEAKAVQNSDETTAETALAAYHALNLAYNTAKATPGADMTFAIFNPSFETGDTQGWTYQTSTDHGAKRNDNATYTMTNCHGDFLFNIWSAGNAISQTVEDLPNGTYKLQAVIATDGGHKVQVNANDQNVQVDAVDKGTGVETEVEFQVINNKATIGAEGVDGYWYKVDNFRLTFVKGINNDELIAAYDKALADANAVEGKMNSGVETALNNAIAANSNVDKTNADALSAATVALSEATTAAKNSVAAYATAKAALDAMKRQMDGTNVYTQEAFDAYNGVYTEKLAAYEAGTLTDAEAKAIENPEANLGWHNQNIIIDDFLLSAWDTEPNYPDGNPYYLNTWSVEGANDGSNFLVPFVEYWTGDGESLGVRTLTATVPGLEPGEYDVTAWVRVRAKNGYTAPVTGITMQVNDGEAVDVAAGTQVGTSQMFLDEFTATGVVGEDGVLTIKFIVAEGNNISWLSFKNVKYVKKETPNDNLLDVVVNHERYVGMGYGTSFATIDMEAAKTFLGVDAIEYSMIRIENPDGTLISDYAPYDGWFTGEGVAESWGANTKINVKFFQAIPDGQFSICDMNGADVVGTTYTVKWQLVNGEKAVRYTINVKFVEAPAVEIAISDLSIKTEVVYKSTDPGYTEKVVSLTDEQVQAICAELGISALTEATVYGYNPSNQELLANYDAYDGWRAANGDFANWTGNATVPACVKYIDGQNYFCYNISGFEGTVQTYWAIATATKAVLVEIDFISMSALDVAKADLASALAAAKAAPTAGKTAESKQALADAITAGEAEADNEAATVETITAAIAALNSAVAGLTDYVDNRPHTWNFTKWSDQTVTDLKAEAAKGTSEGLWSDQEKADSSAVTKTLSLGNCFWQVGSCDPAGETLMANGNEIAETKGLLFTVSKARTLAIAVNYPDCTPANGNGFGPYQGPAYLWLGNKNLDCFTIKNVKAGSVIKMGVESHKMTDARGVKLLVNGAELMDEDGNAVAVPTTYAEQSWKVSGDEGTVDVIVRNTNGCHIYFIDAVIFGPEEQSAAKALEDEIAAAQALAAAHPEATEQALAEFLAAIEAAVDALDAAVSAESLAKALASLKGAEADFLNTAVGIVSVESAVKAGNVFNLKGQKVQQTNRKGLYVVNGKKVVK